MDRCERGWSFVDLGILLALAYQEFVVELRESLVHEGFDDTGRSDGYVFRALATRPMTVSALASRLQISKQGGGRSSTTWSGGVTWSAAPTPPTPGARLPFLSPRGNAALASARRFHQAYERRLARTHGRPAVAALRAMLEAMAGGEERTLDPNVRALFL